MIAVECRRGKQSLFILSLPDYHSDNQRKTPKREWGRNHSKVLIESKVIGPLHLDERTYAA
jgi:hypothetical protein